MTRGTLSLTARAFPKQKGGGGVVMISFMMIKINPPPTPHGTAPDMQHFRRLNGVFYGGSCGCRSVSLI